MQDAIEVPYNKRGRKNILIPKHHTGKDNDDYYYVLIEKLEFYIKDAQTIQNKKAKSKLIESLESVKLKHQSNFEKKFIKEKTKTSVLTFDYHTYNDYFKSKGSDEIKTV